MKAQITRILSLILIAAMAASFAACGGTGDKAAETAAMSLS